MPTPTHHPQAPSVVIPVKGDNLDDLMQEVMIGFQLSTPTPTDSTISSPGRMSLFYSLLTGMANSGAHKCYHQHQLLHYRTRANLLLFDADVFLFRQLRSL